MIVFLRYCVPMMRMLAGIFQCGKPEDDYRATANLKRLFQPKENN